MQDGWDGPSRQVSTYILKDLLKHRKLSARRLKHPGWRPFFPSCVFSFVCWEAAEGILAGSGVRAPKLTGSRGAGTGGGSPCSPFLSLQSRPRAGKGGHTDCHQLDQPQQVGRPPIRDGWVGGLRYFQEGFLCSSLF